jgi:hypothetical protein
MYFANLRRPAEWIGFLSLVSILIVMFTPIMVVEVHESADYSDHILDAQSWLETGSTIKPRPHFLYHSLLIGVHWLIPGGSVSTSAVVVGVIFYVVLGSIIYLVMRPLFADWSPLFGIAIAFVLTLGLMLVSPINLLTIPTRNLYLGYIAPHVYHNPTMVILKPFALLLFSLALNVFVPNAHSGKILLLTFAFGALSTMSKPNFAICIVPTLGFVAGHRFLHKAYVNWRLLIIGVFVSVGLVLAWQYLFFRSSGMGGFGIAPLKVMSYYSPENLLPKLLLSSLFPLCVYLSYVSVARHDLPLNLAWLAFLFGLLYTYAAIEPREWQSGNFLWSGQITLLILFIVSCIFFIQHAQRNQFAFYVCALVLGLHFISGIVWYYVQLIDPIYTWW